MVDRTTSHRRRRREAGTRVVKHGRRRRKSACACVRTLAWFYSPCPRPRWSGGERRRQRRQQRRPAPAAGSCSAGMGGVVAGVFRGSREGCERAQPPPPAVRERARPLAEDRSVRKTVHKNVHRYIYNIIYNFISKAEFRYTVQDIYLYLDIYTTRGLYLYYVLCICRVYYSRTADGLTVLLLLCYIPTGVGRSIYYSGRYRVTITT